MKRIIIGEPLDWDEARKLVKEHHESDDFVSVPQFYSGCRPRTFPEPTDSEILQEMQDNMTFNFEYEKELFDNWLNTQPGRFWLCGSLGLWDGRRTHAYPIKGFNDLFKFDQTVIYEEDGVFHVDQSHHDGVNRYVLVKELDAKTSTDRLGYCDEVYGPIIEPVEVT